MILLPISLKTGRRIYYSSILPGSLQYLTVWSLQNRETTGPYNSVQLRDRPLYIVDML